jgi:hypothetical protein
LADIQQTTDTIRDAVPLELQGFVISAIIVIGIMIVMTLFFWLMRNRLHPAEVTEAAVQKPQNKQIKTGNKEQQKTRQAAVDMGFMADDVERDAPVDMTFLQDAEHMQRRSCARYVYPEHVERNAEWSLLRRPWMGGSGDVGKGWQLDWRKGERDAATMTLIRDVTHDDRWKNRFLEMEMARNTLTLYWDEFGGKAQVENLRSFQEKLKTVSVHLPEETWDGMR